MKPAFLSWTLSLTLILLGSAAAREIILPAGTLLQCTLDEPNFSSATANVGDPVLCHPRAVQQFGQSVFPRGTYLVGHLESAKDPGHFVGKGNLKLEFDRIGLPSTDLPLPGKVIAVRGYRVDRDGKIIGHGHATRDTVEWMLPPLWPWKVLMLPARGPRPALKGEVTVTMRLMDDVSIPQASAWRRFGQSDDQSLNLPRSFAHPADATASQALPLPTLRTVASETSLPAFPPTTQPVPGLRYASQTVTPTLTRAAQTQLTLFALKSGTIYAAANYQADGGILQYTLSNGDIGSVRLSEIDWDTTTGLNSERNVRVSLRRAPSASDSLIDLSTEQ